MTRQQAIDLISAMPSHQPSIDREPDPDLWFAWCNALGRDPMPSEVWSEWDVCHSAILHLTRHVFHGAT